MGMKRKWINAKITRNMCWWNCPGTKCLEIIWKQQIPILEDMHCSKCNTDYKIMQTDKVSRILIEVEDETESRRT